MKLLLLVAELVLAAGPADGAAGPDAPLVLQASAGVFGEVVGRAAGAELGLSLALWRYVDLGAGLSVGNSPGALLTARFHFGWQPDRRIRPFVQLRARFHPLTQGVGGGAQAGALIELGPGRVTLGIGGELMAPVPDYPIGLLLGLVAYELDLVGSHRAPAAAEPLAGLEPRPTEEPSPQAKPLAVQAVTPAGTSDAGTADLGTVSVQLTDGKGGPVAAKVALLASGDRPEPVQTLEGSAVEFRAPLTDHRLEVTAPGFLAVGARVALAPGKRSTYLTLELKPAPAEPSARLREKQIELGSQIQFGPLGDTVLPASQAVLDEVVDLLVRTPQVRQVLIVAHTDKVGSAAQQRELTERQAQAVMLYLVEKGISLQRLVGEGAGATKPVAAQNTAAGRRLNRRITIEILERSR